MPNGTPTPAPTAARFLSWLGGGGQLTAIPVGFRLEPNAVGVGGVEELDDVGVEDAEDAEDAVSWNWESKLEIWESRNVRLLG